MADEIQGRLFDTSPDQRPLFHRDDPESSREAAKRLEESGNLQRHADIVLAIVKRNPGLTAVELWEKASAAEQTELVEMQEVRRRLTCLAVRGLVEQGPQRACTVRKSLQVTWVAL